MYSIAGAAFAVELQAPGVVGIRVGEVKHAVEQTIVIDIHLVILIVNESQLQAVAQVFIYNLLPFNSFSGEIVGPVTGVVGAKLQFNGLPFAAILYSAP